MRIRQTPLSQVRPYPANPRRNHDVEGIARSIQVFGWRQPIVVWEGDGHILVGHGRYLAAQKLGLAKVPVHTVGADEMTAELASGYRIADNKSAELSEWDERQLLAELELMSEQARRDAGFDEAEQDELRRRIEMDADHSSPDEDEVPEPPAAPATRPGDLWHLGPHLLLCGDATSKEDVARLGDHGHLMVTDPPYGVSYDADWRDKHLPSAAKRSTGTVSHDDQADWRSAWELFAGDVAYVWSAAGGHLVVSGGALLASGFELRSEIIWRKQSFVIGRGHYHFQHEPCWYAVRKGTKAHWRGDRTQSTVWTVNNASSAGHTNVDDGKTNHSTQKPVEVMRRPILNNSRPGDCVYDPFVGSGTTIIAAESTGRRCCAIELNPIYVDMAIIRWQNFAGEKATLDQTGETFDALRAVRSAEPLVAAAG